MTVMNDSVRALVKQTMLERHMTQTELAKRVGLERPAVSRLLNGAVGKIPENWQRILDELNIELIAVKKSRD